MIKYISSYTEDKVDEALATLLPFQKGMKQADMIVDITEQYRNKYGIIDCMTVLKQVSDKWNVVDRAAYCIHEVYIHRNSELVSLLIENNYAVLHSEENNGSTLLMKKRF